MADTVEKIEMLNPEVGKMIYEVVDKCIKVITLGVDSLKSIRDMFATVDLSEIEKLITKVDEKYADVLSEHPGLFLGRKPE